VTQPVRCVRSLKLLASASAVFYFISVSLIFYTQEAKCEGKLLIKTSSDLGIL